MSMAIVLLLIHNYFSHSVCVLSLFCEAVLSVLSSFSIILVRKKYIYCRTLLFGWYCGAIGGKNAKNMRPRNIVSNLIYILSHVNTLVC